jgi:hypothetical protein
MIMRYGDKDGFGSIYDSNGDLMLHQGEKVLVTEENVIPSLKSTWRYYGGEYLLEPSKGNVYLTNERFVFINIPERMYAIGGSKEMRAMESASGSSFGIGGLPTGGSQREYFEIPNIEIMASERREGAVSVGQMVNVYILSSGNQYHLSLVLTEDSNLLSRLMNKRIKNLDELVNNLKQFFQQTDWMYTDVEKTLLSKGAKQEDASSAPQTSPERPSQETSVVTPTSEGVARTPIRRSPKLGEEQMKYFENLFNKGLITKDVYDRLVGEYTASPAQERPGKAPQAQSSVQPPGPVVPDAAKARTNDSMSDQDLLDILSGAMSGMPSPEPQKALEVPEEPAAPPAQAKKAKKVMKLPVKA